MTREFARFLLLCGAVGLIAFAGMVGVGCGLLVVFR